MAYGSVLHPVKAERAASSVLKYRGLELPQELKENNDFYGLGWDIQEDQFKIYYRSSNWQELHPALSELTSQRDSKSHLKEALVSFTFTGNQVSERKVYLYPKERPENTSIRGTALMLTSSRGQIEQDDLASSSQLPYKINGLGQRIVELYRSIPEQLDTISYRSHDDFTLYFP